MKLSILTVSPTQVQILHYLAMFQFTLSSTAHGLLPCCPWHVRVHAVVAVALLLARPGPLSDSCCAAAGTSGSALLWLLCCCWHVRVHAVVAVALLLAHPGPLCCTCCAAAGTSGSALLCLLLARPGPGPGPRRCSRAVNCYRCARVRVPVVSSGSHWRHVRVPALLCLSH